jgi:hypothetical protein
MSRELDALQPFMAETDPEPTWRAAYEDASAKYNLLKWIAYPTSFFICVGGFLLFAFALTSVLQPENMRIGYAAFAATYDAIALRVLVGLTSCLPWPPWFREFCTLHDTLKPFDRVMRRKNGEPDPDVI